MKLEQFSTNKNIIRGLQEMGFTEPTPIQEQSIPLTRSGIDVIGISKTGSGKTAAFSVPILEKVQPIGRIQALIMTPTRELAVQITREIEKFGKYLDFSITTIYGGVSINPQMDALQRADIVVGTPGRLLDHVNRNTINLTKVDHVVLDEADKMVEMGFIEDVSRIINYTSKDKQMILFGATISQEIEHIKRKHMNNPSVIKTEAHVKEEYLEQFYYNIDSREKFSLLAHLLGKDDIGRAIVFCSKRSTVDLVSDNLRKNGIKASAIHGKLTQNRRLAVIDGFNNGKVKLLVASAVAARGLDIKDVTHVFNYDLPQDSEEYVHRIGRTARAGKSGKAITLLSREDYPYFDAILRRYPLKVEPMPHEDFPKLNFEVRKSGGFGGNNRFGRRSFGGPRRGSSRGSDRNSFGNRESSGRKPHPFSDAADRPRRFSGSKNFGNKSSNFRENKKFNSRDSKFKKDY